MKRGRPSIPATKRRRITFQFRATAAEVSAWRRRAGEVPLSQWVRDRLNSAS